MASHSLHLLRLPSVPLGVNMRNINSEVLNMRNKTHKLIRNMYRSGEVLHTRLYDLHKHKQALIEELENTERKIAATNDLLQGFHEAAIGSQELINGDDE